MEIVVLGSGASMGVPVIGCKCEVCLSTNRYNKRSRCAILIKADDANVLIDCDFEIRQQLVESGIEKLNAIVITHEHADKISGIDDLRAFWFKNGDVLDTYANVQTLQFLTTKFNYMFSQFFLMRPYGPFLKAHELKYHTPSKIGGIEMTFFPQDHGSTESLGVRVGNFLYANDIFSIPAESEEYFYNVEQLLIDCVDYESTFTHIGLEAVLKIVEKYQPKKVYLTNMSHKLCYEKLCDELPEHIRPSYDGMVIKI